MNLQICSPYRRCPFACPMCIAATEDGEKNNVYNLWKNNRVEYFQRLDDFLENSETETMVITGDTEPTLFPDWISEILNFYSLPMELQTKNYNIPERLFENIESKLSVLAYSVTCPADFQKMKNVKTLSNGTNRIVILLTQAIIDYFFEQFLDDGKKKETLEIFGRFQQITFKELQLPEKEDNQTFVLLNKCESKIHKNLLIEYLNRHFPDTTIFYDKNCMDAKNRYNIYRINGEFYDEW